MVSDKITVNNPSGLHLRPAGEFTKICKNCTSKITVNARGKTVNPKSILSLLSAEIIKGTEIEIICEGPDEEADLQLLLDAIRGGLGESV